MEEKKDIHWGEGTQNMYHSKILKRLVRNRHVFNRISKTSDEVERTKCAGRGGERIG
eukprot:CAMPEP_0184335996 /NCGR_PEP_ID=MMETSP1089-20130417/4461_1 /TAXON_ID=38269 ORGANISM="Gloeochaete wittrockiana, Strain SAG46.84" /NCGR_SAMPLE_ID=MMETSP1089 /ASSEMBLY_ACC=CAM_ASM_000445 /LENGTH=56 /DNA_ID=CAMNT_0026660913 /DNA_START=406 /DNA_END=573 /DNA_ORIENTATION=-